MYNSLNENLINIALLNNKCILFEQIFLSLKDKFNIINFYDGCNEKPLEKLMHQKDGIIILDLHCMNIIHDEMNLKQLSSTNHLPIILFLKRDETIPAKLLNNKKIKQIIVLPCNMNDIIEQIELVSINQKNYGTTHAIETNINQKRIIELNFIKKLEKVIHTQIELEDVSVASIASKMSITTEKLNHSIKKITGKTAVQYILSFRLDFAKKMLEQNELNIKEVAIKTCFLSLSYFTKAFKNSHGILPSKYKLTL